eukprot:scaffold17228_cov49-Cyclotella_meneghiniana.AAC.4
MAIIDQKLDRSRYEMALYKLAFDAYDEYYVPLSNVSKEIFKEILLTVGTDACVRAAKEKDLTKEPEIVGVLHLICMMKIIEVRDSYNGAWNMNICGEILTQIQDTLSPRETVRLFHRRNSCDCIKELYYKLKENTKRTSICWRCRKRVDIRTINQCQCKVANYCSYDCAAAHHPSHKELCKQWRISNGPFYGIEKVD